MYYAFTAYPRAEPKVMATKPHCNCCKISIITLARIGSELLQHSVAFHDFCSKKVSSCEKMLIIFFEKQTYFAPFLQRNMANKASIQFCTQPQLSYTQFHFCCFVQKLFYEIKQCSQCSSHNSLNKKDKFKKQLIHPGNCTSVLCTIASQKLLNELFELFKAKDFD